MSQWIGDKEVGLAPGQTGGDVGGTYITRPEGYDPNVVFVVESKEQSAQKKKLLESKTATHTSAEEYGRQIRYLQAIGRPVTPQSKIYVKPNLTLGQLHLLEDMPRASGAAPAQMRQDYYPSFTPYAPRIEQQLPSTPIQRKTPAGYGYVTYPLYEKASNFSNWMQGGIEKHINVAPVPSEVKQLGSGFYGFFTGLPAWGASGIVGWEVAARTEDKKKLPSMFAGGAVRMGSDIVQQAKAEPFKMAGFGLGMIAAPHVMKAPELNIKNAGVKMFGRRVSIESIKTPKLTDLKITKASDIEVRGIWTPATAERGALKYLAAKLSKPEKPQITVSSIKPVASKLSVSEKMFGQRQTPTTGARLPSIKSELTPSYSKMFGVRTGRITGDTMAGIKSAITPSYSKLFGTGRMISKEAETTPKATTWNLKPTPEYLQGKYKEFDILASGRKIKPSPRKPIITERQQIFSKLTPEYIQGKFTESNVFRGGDIKQISESLKRAPTALQYPHQLRGFIISKKLPKQLTPGTPAKGLTFIETKPTKPSTTATREIKMGNGMVQLQKVVQKPIQKTEVITIQKPASKVLTRSNILKVMAAASMMGIASQQKAVQITRQVPSLKTRAVLMSALKLFPMVASVSIPRAATTTKTSALAITKPVSIQESRTLTETIQKSMQATRQITRQRTDLMVDMRKPQRLKGSSLFPPIRKKKKHKRSFGAFPELSRIATPSRLLTGTFSMKKKRFRL